jgi:adenylate cyclase
MSSIIEGYNYDIFISYRQKDNKGERWVSEFVEALKTELESTFKEEISVYFDINPHDGLLETHDVDASLKEKLKCLVFLPIISRTYCDPKSFAWEHEFKAFVEQASKDQFGLKVKLPGGNVANRVLPVPIHDLDFRDNQECVKVLDGVLRGVEFIYKSTGVNRPLRSKEDCPNENLNKTFYRDQINKVALATKEIISVMKNEPIESFSERGKAITNEYKTLLKEKSIIVLPFENMSPDPDQEYFSDGLTEEIITDLTHIKDLLVISRNSAMTFKGTNKKTVEISSEVNVRYVLEGSVRKAGNNLRITAQLIDGINDIHIWAEKYDGTLDDVFTIQEKVSQSIAKALKIKLVPKKASKVYGGKTLKATSDLSNYKKRVIDDKSTKSIKAYNFYLRGRYFSNQHTEEGFKKGIEFYNKAIEINKKYALAYVGLARCYEELSRLSFIPFNTGFQKAKQAIIKALELDKKSGEAYATLGSLKLAMDWDIVESEYDFERALELNPGSIDIIRMYTQYLTWTGRFDKGIELAEKGLELDPLTPFTIFNLGFILFFSGKYDKSISQLNDCLSIDPKFVWAYMYLAYNYVMKQMYDKAIFYADNAISVWPTEHTSIPSGFMGWVYIKSGFSNKAQELLSQLQRMRKNSGLDPYCMAVIYSGLNQNDKAIEWLNKAYEDHSGLMLYLKVHSKCFFKNLVSDSRFYDLLIKMGFSNNSK